MCITVFLNTIYHGCYDVCVRILCEQMKISYVISSANTLRKWLLCKGKK